MNSERPKTLHYKRSHFATQLPVGYRYSLSHFWLTEVEPGLWRVGLTRFAVRMLGDMVDHGFDVQPGEAVEPGQRIGWIEGFKAISDLYCVARGAFEGGNPALHEHITLINEDCYGEGWLYLVRGQPDEQCLDVYAYRDLLDKTIDRILEQQQLSGQADSEGQPQ